MEAKIVVRVEDTIHGVTAQRGYRTFGRAVKYYTELCSRTVRNGHNRVVMIDCRTVSVIELMSS